MTNTNNTRANFGKKASLTTGAKPLQKTYIIVNKDGISITISHISAAKVEGHTRVDFESKRRKDSYKELNKILGEG